MSVNLETRIYLRSFLLLAQNCVSPHLLQTQLILFMQADSDCFNSESICIMRLANMGGISQKTLYIFYCTQDYFNDVFIYELVLVFASYSFT